MELTTDGLFIQLHKSKMKLAGCLFKFVFNKDLLAKIIVRSKVGALPTVGIKKSAGVRKD